MNFMITPKLDGRLIRLKVQLIYKTDTIERFEVIARNKTLVFETNRLLFINKGLKHRKGQWKLISGHINYSYHREKIQEAIDEKLATL